MLLSSIVRRLRQGCLPPIIPPLSLYLRLLLLLFLLLLLLLLSEILSRPGAAATRPPHRRSTSGSKCLHHSWSIRSSPKALLLARCFSTRRTTKGKRRNHRHSTTTMSIVSLTMHSSGMGSVDNRRQCPCYSTVGMPHCHPPSDRGWWRSSCPATRCTSGVQSESR